MVTGPSNTPSTPYRRRTRETAHTTSTPFLTPSKNLSTSRAIRTVVPRPSPTPNRLRPNTTPNRRQYISSVGKTPYFTPQGTPFNGDDDRFIPSRRRMNMDLCRRALLSGQKRSNREADPSSSPPPSDSSPSQRATEETPLQKEFKRRMLSTLCNIPLEKLDENGEPVGIFAFGSGSNSGSRSSGQSSFRAGRTTSFERVGAGRIRLDNPFEHDLLRMMKVGENDLDPSADLSVASKVLRKVPSAPIRILDAPDIVDDYYLNLISWSKDNILAVALAQSVYLWNATTGDIQHLVTVDQSNDYITSISWSTTPGQSRYIAVGTNANVVHLYDGHALRKVRSFSGHTARVSSLAWNQNYLTSGSRDSLILNHDVRASQQQHIVSKYVGHEQEVCGLKWNEDGSTLASGGNENLLCLWDAAMSNTASFYQQRHRRRSAADLADHAPRLVLKHHKAAVKAIDWCPFHRGLLASGGGTADRSIKFWNAASGAMLNSIDTGSQVCSIIWSKHQRELCSSHGYSENQLILWKYPTMTKVKELRGHTARVLNMEMSPDGSSIVSAAADETLRFWNVFGNPSTFRRTCSSAPPLVGDLSFGGHAIR